MKRIILCFAATLLISGSFFACEKKNQCEKIVINPIVNNPQATLVNTNWKCVGFVDVAKECLKRIEQPDPKYYADVDYYTLNFYTTDTLSGRTTTNTFCVNYEVDYETGDFRKYGGIITSAGEAADGQRYSDALFTVQSFSFQGNELRLYYNNKLNYLLFKTQ